jgi:hypothetical protein
MFKNLVFFVYTNGSCNIHNFKKKNSYSMFFEKDFFKEIFYMKKLSKNYYFKGSLKFFKSKYGV